MNRSNGGAVNLFAGGRGIGLPLVLAAAGLLVLAADARALDTLTASDAIGLPGELGVQVTLTESNDLPMQGFSIALAYPTAEIDFAQISWSGTVVETITGGVPDYVGMTDDPVAGVFIMGVIFDTQPVVFVEIPATPDPLNPNTLVHLFFDMDALATPGDYLIDLANGLGDPPVNNTFSSDGVSILPELNDGTLTIVNENFFRIPDTQSLVGGVVSTRVLSTHVDANQGFVVALTYDNAVLTVDQAHLDGLFTDPAESECLDVELLLNPFAIEFYLPLVTLDIVPGRNWISAAVIYDFVPPFDGQTLPPGDDLSIFALRFTVANNPALDGTCTTIDLINGLGSPPIDNIITVAGFGLLPALIDGTICIASTGLEVFQRGNANGDPTINLADGIFIINYLFSSGPPPGCFDAADANDDGSVDISDTITIINWLFAGGCPPQPPFPFCGVDASPDALNCAFFPQC